MNIQIFGTKKCAETRKAQRWFKERAIKFQFIDLAEKAMTAGELRSVAGRVGGTEAMIDRDGKRYESKNLKYMAPTGVRIETALLEDPLLLKTPIVRNGAVAAIGYQPDVWATWS